MTKFQIALTGVFAFFILVAVFTFSFSRGGKRSVERFEVTIWGTFPNATFIQAYNSLPISNDRNAVVRYEEKNPATFDAEFVEALASGVGPDLVLIPHGKFLKHKNKFLPIPYNSYPERTFRDTFVEQGELFLAADGIYALPISIDPLVMYWNRSTFSSNGLSRPPQQWSEFFGLSQNLTVRDAAFNVTKSAVALGEYRNIVNAKAILSTLIMQAGSPIVEAAGNGYKSALSDRRGLPITPTDAALSFYTEFSDPAKPYYSWNRSLSDSQTRFLAGDVAVYFGFASELLPLQVKNPNLNFDVAPMPQSAGSQYSITYGELWGVALVRASKSPAGAYRVATALSSAEGVRAFATQLRVPPVRRDLLAQNPASDPYLSTFYTSALWSKGWLDPDPDATAVIFADLVESITAGRMSQQQAITLANTQLQRLLDQ